MDINEIVKYCTDNSVILTQHLVLRMHERNIKYDDVMATIRKGKIVEDYPNDFPYPSCLILGNIDYPLHVVCGLGDGKLFYHRL